MVTEQDLKNMHKAFAEMQRQFNALRKDYDELDERVAACVASNNEMRAALEGRA